MTWDSLLFIDQNRNGAKYLKNYVKVLNFNLLASRSFWRPLLLVDQNKKYSEVTETFLESFVFDEQCALGTSLSV